MDIRAETAEPTFEEREAVEAVLRAHGAGELGAVVSGPGAGHLARGGHAARARRHLLLPVLHALQARRGFLSREALGHVARVLEVPPAEIFSVASFYHWFSLEE